MGTRTSSASRIMPDTAHLPRAGPHVFSLKSRWLPSLCHVHSEKGPHHPAGGCFGRQGAIMASTKSASTRLSNQVIREVGVARLHCTGSAGRKTGQLTWVPSAALHPLKRPSRKASPIPRTRPDMAGSQRPCGGESGATGWLHPGQPCRRNTFCRCTHREAGPQES